MNREWATEQLDALLGHTEFYRRPDPPGVVNFTSQLSTCRATLWMTTWTPKGVTVGDDGRLGLDPWQEESIASPA
jgi:hypothetical protein